MGAGSKRAAEAFFSIETVIGEVKARGIAPTRCFNVI